MSLAELEADLKEQEAVPARRFTRPRDVFAYITDDKPAKVEKVIIDMCVMQVEERDLCWHIYMIEKGTESDFEQRKAIVLKLHDSLKKKYVFCLSLWKAKKQSRDHVTGDDYVPGRSYAIANVNGLHIYGDVAQGSVQARFAVKTEGDEGRTKSKRKMKDPKP